MIARSTETWELPTEALLNEDHLFQSFLTFDGACSCHLLLFPRCYPFMQKDVACCYGSQGEGVSRSLMPTSFFENLSMAKDNHRHEKTTLNEVRALTLPLPV